MKGRCLLFTVIRIMYIILTKLINEAASETHQGICIYTVNQWQYICKGKGKADMYSGVIHGHGLRGEGLAWLVEVWYA